MKKLWSVLLSLGLIFSLCATASAADVKFGGSYYVVGMYDSNRQLADTDATYSRALFRQRVRLQPAFQVADGLTFTARMDALEKAWGNTAWASDGKTTTDNPSKRQSSGAAGAYVQENIEFEQGWVAFTTGVGQFRVGYQTADVWGTSFGDNGDMTRPRIIYITALGPVILAAVYEKIYEADLSAANDRKVDADADTYSMSGVYKFKDGEAGLLYKYYAVAYTKPSSSFKALIHLLSPYAKATVGPVYMEAEANYFFGKARKFDDNAGTDVDEKTITAYLMAKMNLGSAFVGAQFGYASGDPNDTTTDRTFNGGGTGWNPALIIGGNDLRAGLGDSNLGGSVSIDSEKKNLTLYNLFGGYNLTEKLVVEAGLSYAKATKALNTYVSDKIGMEFDVKVTYKIFDNLAYMVAGGYLWSGDYFKGTSAANQVGNDYVLLNRLTLSF